MAVDAKGAGLAVELAVKLALALGARYGAGLAEVEVVARAARSLVVGARSLVGVMVKKKPHRFV